MGKRNSNYAEIILWIEKVIDSCETYDQTFTAKKLINVFSKQCPKSATQQGKNEFYDIIRLLELMILAKKKQLRG